MAKLQEIDYTTPVQDSSGGFAQLNAEQQKTAGVFAQGFHALGSEMVKAQHYRASADLLTQLENAQLDLKAQKTISGTDLRKALGADYDSLPPEIKAQTTRSELDPQTGQPHEVDRNDIPMFAVAGHIFDARAKKILSDVNSNFTSQGWAAEFQDQAMREVQAQKFALGRQAMHDSHEYIQHQTLTSAIDAANAGRPDLARQMLADTRALDPSIRVQAESHVDKIEQTRPLYEALRTGNIAEMAKMLPALGDSKQFTKLSEEERLGFTNRLEAEIKQFQDGIKRSDDQVLTQNAERGWNGIFEKERAGQSVSYGDIPMPGTVKAEAQKSMIEYVDKLNKGEKPETDWKLYAGLLDASKDRAKFGQVNLLNYRNRLADGEFKQLLELQQGMKGGNADAYDHFQNTDEAISVRLAMAPYNFDVKDKDKAEQISYIKAQVQTALAKEQEANNGKPLPLEKRNAVIDATLRDTVDPKKEGMLGGWIPFTGTASGTPAFKAGVSPTIAATFQAAVGALRSKEMSGNFNKRTQTLKEEYSDYESLEPHIEKAWMLQRGKPIDPNDAVQAWYYVRMNRDRLENVLRRDGELGGNKAAQDFKITNLAIYELLQKASR